MLLGVGYRKVVEDEWEAFKSFARWLDDGTYNAGDIVRMHSHVDAYLLSETLSSQRFGNAVMRSLLIDVRSRKFDPSLKYSYRQIFAHCTLNSPLRKLYFEASVFWRIEFGGGGNAKRTSMWAEGVLGLDPAAAVDKRLIQELELHKKKFCVCKNRRISRIRGKALPVVSQTGYCKCSREPWFRSPKRFFATG